MTMRMTQLKADLKNLYERRDLLRQMIQSKLVAGQKDLMLGYLWWILEPLLFMGVYWLLVSVIFQRGGKGYPLFVLCGLVPYRAFAISFSQSVGAISGKFSLLGQLNFPRAFLPLADVLTNHVKLVFGLLVVVGFALAMDRGVSWRLGYVLVPFAMQTMFVAGLSLFTSVLGVYFRDLKNLMQFTNRILLYLSPVIYAIDRIPESYRDIYTLNPIACWVESYRQIIIQQRFPELSLVVTGFLEAIAVCVLGYLFFSRQEKKILKYI